MTMPNVQGQVGQTTVSGRMPSVNLMPPEIAAAARFRRFKFAMGGAVAAAVVIVAALDMHSHSAVNDAQAALDAANTQHTQLQAKLASLQSVQAVYSEVAAKQAMLREAMGQEIRWSFYLNDLALKIPDNVWLTNIQAQETSTGLGTTTTSNSSGSGSLVPSGIGTVTFTGVAFSHDDVATWLDALAKEKGYTFPYFTNSAESKIGPRSVVNFTSSVVLTDTAKSGRYETPAGS